MQTGIMSRRVGMPWLPGRWFITGNQRGDDLLVTRHLGATAILRKRGYLVGLVFHSRIEARSRTPVRHGYSGCRRDGYISNL